MSVLIKGMDIPYGCANCNFVGSPIYDSKGRAIYSCNVPVDGISGKNVTEQVIDMYEGGGGDYFPDWCPLVEISEKHGRLIEADKLKEEFPKDTDWEYPVNTNEYVCEMIDNANTVIEAEDS